MEAPDIARAVRETDNAAEWLCFMAQVGPKPSGRLTLHANHTLCVRFELVEDCALTPLGLEVANIIARPI